MISFNLSDNILVCNGQRYEIPVGDYPTWKGLAQLGVNQVSEFGIEWLVFPGIVEEGTTLSNNYFFHNLEIGQSSCRSYMYEYIDKNIDILVGSEAGDLIDFTTLDLSGTEVKFVSGKSQLYPASWNILEVTNEKFPILSSLFDEYNIQYTIQKFDGCYYVIEKGEKLYGYDIISDARWMNPFRYSSNMLAVNNYNYLTDYELNETIKVKGQQLYPTIFDITRGKLLQKDYTGWVTLSSLAALLDPAHIMYSNNNSIIIGSDMFCLMCGRNFFNNHSKYTAESIKASSFREVLDKYPSDYLDNLSTTQQLFTPNYNDDYLVLLTNNKYHYVQIDSNAGVLLCSADSTVYKANLMVGINYLKDYNYVVNEYSTEMIYAHVDSSSSYFRSISSNSVSLVGLAWSDSISPITLTINGSKIVFTSNSDISVTLSNPSNLSITSTGVSTLILKAISIRKLKS